MNEQSIINILKSGKDNWNVWHSNNPQTIILSNLNLDNLELGGFGRYFGGYLRDVSFINCSLKKASFHCGHIKGARFIKCDLSDADFARAWLENIEFTDSILTNATFYRCQAFHIDFTNVDLSGADFRITFPEDLNLKNAKINRLISSQGGWEYDEFGQSMLDLARMKNIEFVHKDSQQFLINYLSNVFNYLSFVDKKDKVIWTNSNGEQTVSYEDAIPEKNAHFFNDAIKKVNALHRLFSKSNFPIDLIQVTEYLNIELLKQLKSNPSKIQSLHWRGFEELIAELLSFYGWQVSLTSKTRDNGYDIFAINKDISGVTHSWLIECKKWSPERTIGIDIIRSLYTVKNDLSVGNVMLATTSHFSSEVEKYKMTKYDLELKDYGNIINWMNEYEPNPNGKLYIKSNRLIIP